MSGVCSTDLIMYLEYMDTIYNGAAAGRAGGNYSHPAAGRDLST
eukprot:SAG31_NODE_9575_length_1256_cov_3.838376_1_plen_44_part_00